jgi:hypothetical protein
VLARIGDHPASRLDQLLPWKPGRAFSANRTGWLTMGAPNCVFTIRRVAVILGEDEERLHRIAVNMEPQDGFLAGLGIKDLTTAVFTRQGI